MEEIYTHQPVMLNAVLEHLVIQPDGIYVDGTYGRGGHSAAILERLSEQGRLFSFDRDPEAVAVARAKHGTDPRFQIRHAAFTELAAVLSAEGLVGKVDGILLDLGVSSPQLEDANRGFSFMQDGPLDMRMDNTQGLTVAEFLTQTDERQLADILYLYGEERDSRRIARAVLKKQAEKPITRTKELADLISAVLPKKNYHKHPATRSFQALRIFINQELQCLETVLIQSLQVLKVSGRLLVLSFHSLEDRIVKNFFRPAQALKGLALTDLQLAAQLRGFNAFKAIKADEIEIAKNPRSRSAILRVAEKIGD